MRRAVLMLPGVSKLADNVDVAQTDDQIGNQDHKAKDHRPDKREQYIGIQHVSHL